MPNNAAKRQKISETDNLDAASICLTNPAQQAVRNSLATFYVPFSNPEVLIDLGDV
jgi:hypothetical protein